MNKFPTIDVDKFFNSTEKEQADYGQEVDLICQETGFLLLKNHGVSKNIITNLWSCAEIFFAYDYEEKIKYGRAHTHAKTHIQPESQLHGRSPSELLFSTTL